MESLPLSEGVAFLSVLAIACVSARWVVRVPRTDNYMAVADSLMLAVTMIYGVVAGVLANGLFYLVGYWCVDDAGTILNPLLFDGQVQGGIVQGAGQILMEDVNYDPESGQLLSGSFMDYVMPRAEDFCRFVTEANEVPTASNPLGAKGVGEAGTTGSMPSIMNAINHALHLAGAAQVEMPATAEKVWRAINQ